MPNEVAKINSQELINQARELAGNAGGNFIPYIPMLSVNNTKIEKEVDVDGVLTKVEVPAKEGFNITIKDEKINDYVTQYYSKELEAVILRVRYSISSKYKVNPRYYSFEFDRFDNMIKVYDENRTLLIDGTYKQIKQHFSTGEFNEMGKPRTSFNLHIILYVDIAGQIYRLKLNGASRSNFFDYIKTFGSNDVFTAYETKFNLLFNDKQQIKFWYIDFERGKSVDLAKEIPLQRELQKYFNVEKFVKQDQVIQEEVQPDAETDYGQGSGYKEEEIRVDQIPF